MTAPKCDLLVPEEIREELFHETSHQIYFPFRNTQLACAGFKQHATNFLLANVCASPRELTITDVCLFHSHFNTCIRRCEDFTHIVESLGRLERKIPSPFCIRPFLANSNFDGDKPFDHRGTYRKCCVLCQQTFSRNFSIPPSPTLPRPPPDPAVSFRKFPFLSPENGGTSRYRPHDSR